MNTTNNARLFNAHASRNRNRGRHWTSREGSWTAYTKLAVSVTWADIEAELLPAMGADGLQALLNAPSRVDALLRSRSNVVPLFDGTRARGMPPRHDTPALRP